MLRKLSSFVFCFRLTPSVIPGPRYIDAEMWWLLLHLDALGIRCYVHTVTQITGPRSWYAPRPHGDVISSSSQHSTAARDWQQLISIIHMQSRCTCPGHMTCLIFGDNCLAPPNISNISSGRRAILQECWWWLAHDRISDVSNRSPLYWRLADLRYVLLVFVIYSQLLLSSMLNTDRC